MVRNMPASDDGELATALDRIPFLAQVQPTAARRLAGLTNINYLVDTGSERVVVREEVEFQRR